MLNREDEKITVNQLLMSLKKQLYDAHHSSIEGIIKQLD